MNIDQQAALMSTNMGAIKAAQNAATWSDHMEDLLSSFGEKAAGLRWLHTKSGGMWKKLSDKLTIVGIVMTSVSSAAGFASTSLDGDSQTAMLYAVSAVGLIASLIQSLKKFYNAEEKAAAHASIAKQFGSFYRMMSMEMGMSREDRRPADALRELVTHEFDRLQMEAPSISGGVIQDWHDAFPNVDNEPDICEDEFIIKIDGRLHVKEEESPTLTVNRSVGSESLDDIV